MTIKRLNKEFIKILKESQLTQLVMDGGEIILDSALSSGILKDVSFFGTIYKLGLFTSDIRTHKFDKQLKAFLFQVKDIPPTERAKMIDRIEQRGDKIGESVIELLDQNASVRKSEILGCFLCNLIKQNLDNETFYRLSYIVQNIFERDIDSLVSYEKGQKISQFSKDSLLSFGLLEIDMRKMPDIPALGGLNNIISKEYKVSSLGYEFIKYQPILT